MPHFDFTFRINDVFAICAALFIIGRLIANKIGEVLTAYEKRLDLHQQALERAGWLTRNSHGELVVALHRPSRAGL